MSRSLHIRDSKISAFGYGVCCFKGPSIIEFCNIQNHGTGILVGETPVAYYDGNEGAVQATGHNPCAAPGVIIRGIGMEAVGGGAFIRLHHLTAGEISGIEMRSTGQHGFPDYGLECETVFGVKIHNMQASGAYNIAAIKVDAQQITTVYHSVGATQAGSTGVAWQMPTTQLAGTLKFEDCYGQDGRLLNPAFPKSILPSGAFLGAEMLCSDSTVPAWTTDTTPVSNVGRPLVGSGTIGSNRVVARYSAVATATAAASWAAGATTITTTAVVPTSVVAGMQVVSATTFPNALTFIGAVVSVAGSTITLTAANFASGGSADKLIFAAWTIAG
jgi:hypothetical protein